jgi:hypothetical protein
VEDQRWNCKNLEAEDDRRLISGLQYRNYRLYFVGQSLSLLGTWMQHAATSWLVCRLTGSALLLGITGFADSFRRFCHSGCRVLPTG